MVKKLAVWILGVVLYTVCIEVILNIVNIAVVFLSYSLEFSQLLSLVLRPLLLCVTWFFGLSLYIRITVEVLCGMTQQYFYPFFGKLESKKRSN